MKTNSSTSNPSTSGIPSEFIEFVFCALTSFDGLRLMFYFFPPNSLGRLAHGVDWRQKLDSQRGAVVATELKNNSCKLAKWTVSVIRSCHNNDFFRTPSFDSLLQNHACLPWSSGGFVIGRIGSSEIRLRFPCLSTRFHEARHFRHASVQAQRIRESGEFY